MSNQYIKAYVKRGEVITDITEERVLNDNGIFENESCLENTINNFNYDLFKQASLIVTPNAKKAGKLYSLKPTNGAGDLDVVRATTATYVGSDGLIKTALANEVRFDYTNASCPSILVEPQRTNLLLRSEEFDNASWIGVNGGLGSLPTRTPNVAIAPDGNLTADLVVFNINNGTSSADLSQIQQNLTLTSSIYTFSIYAKSSDNITRILKIAMPSGNVFDITITSNWQRFIVTDTAVGTGAIRLRLRGNESTAKIANLYLWGAQLEAGSNATSYIPTVASTVTRNADVIYKSGISSLIGQTEGTLFADVNIKRIGIPTRQISNLTNGTSNFLSLGFLNTNVLRVIIRANAGTQYNVSTSALPIGRYKLAATYKAGELKLYVNGVLIGTNTNASVSWSAALDRLNLDSFVLGTDNFSDDINLVSHWKTALTDQECIALTTL